MKPLVILHGALGAQSQFLSLKQQLQNNVNVHTLDFSGHGSKASSEEPLSMDLFVADVIQYLDEQQLEQVNIFGYSMGGFIALLLANRHPERVASVFTLATKFAWSPDTAEKEVKMLDPEKIKQKVPAFAQMLAERHRKQHWEKVMDKTAELMRGLGQHNPLSPEILQQVQAPVQLSVGDRDAMTSIEETVAVYRHLPNANLLVWPHTPHPFEKLNQQRLMQELQWFFNF